VGSPLRRRGKEFLDDGDKLGGLLAERDQTTASVESGIFSAMSEEDPEPAAPAPTDTGYFTDEAELPTPASAQSEAELAVIVAALLRVDLSGVQPGALLRSFTAASPAEQLRLAFAWTAALQSDELAAWTDADAARRGAAEAIVLQIAPRDPSPDHNRASSAFLARGCSWDDTPYAVIIVPGYTPLALRVASRGVHPVTLRRLEQAARDLRDGKAPLVLVTGGNIHPKGTPYHEAIEMKQALLDLGVAEERILVEARARHSTTNLRNAGRIMLAHGMARGLITTVGGGIGGSDVFDQDFYFSHPTLSTFHLRSRRELGYVVGELEGAGEHHTAFTPSPSVRRVGVRDALDP
jgi:hypothetical protein